MELYNPIGGNPIQNPHSHFNFPSGAKISFHHMEHEKNRYDWQGSQIPHICCKVDTNIVMADGKLKQAGKLVKGDKLKTLNGEGTVTFIGSPRKAECVSCIDGKGNEQIQTKDHKILTRSGWVSYDDIVCEPHQHHDMERPSQHHSSCISSLLFYKKLLSLPQYLLRSFYRFLHILRFWKLQQDHQPLSVISSYMGQQGLGICFESSVCDTLALLPRALGRHLRELLKPFFLLSEGCSFFFVQSGAAANGLLVSSQQDYPKNYSSCLRPYGEPTVYDSNNNQGHVLQLNGVVIQNRIDSLSCETGTIHKDIHYGLQYEHPYKHEAQIAEEGVCFSSVTMSPCGIHDVIDITVSPQCHYITQSGIINKNCFDEITHFTWKQFNYMLSRLRSGSGVKGTVKATCNPDPDHWIRSWIDWWIGEDGLAIPERSGVIRWFIVEGDEILWGDTAKELTEKYPHAIPKSFTFIRSSVFDNKILLEQDPGYLANLHALTRVEKARLLEGNWNIRATAGSYFKRGEFEIVDSVPANTNRVRAWDLAATKRKETAQDKERKSDDPDWTAGCLMSEHNGIYYIEDIQRFREEAPKVEGMIKNIASSDPRYTKVRLPQDPGQAGKAQAKSYIQALAGYDVVTYPVTGDKEHRATPLAAQVQAGNVKLVKGKWNEAFLIELENFPDGIHDDQVDAASDAFDELTNKKRIAGTW
jgi:predicted phage terminase large subunit-like protein